MQHDFYAVKNKQKNLMRKHGVFLLSAIQEKRPDVARIGRFVPLSLLIQARNGPQDARHQRPGIK